MDIRTLPADPASTATSSTQLATNSGRGAGREHADRRPWLLRSRWRLGLLVALGLTLVLILLLALTAPLSKSLQPITAPSLTLLSAEGRPIARRGAVLEAPVTVAKLPTHVVEPFLAIEDRRFYDHLGIDPRGLARATLANLKAGGVVEGGSTISQQLAKLAYLSPDQTIVRKLQEVVLAFWLEAWLSKDEILSRYLSSVYFGDNVFGLRAAAQHYFSRAPEDLTLEQAAMLAGLVKAPSKLAPTHDLEAARERATLVVQAMVEAGMLTADQAERVPPARLKVGAVKDLPTGTYFADWVLPQAEAALEERVAQHQLVTTLEDRLQREAAAAIRSAGLGGAQVALVAMRPDGRVVAMVGGKSYRRSSFNRATQARRQPGSTFKLFVYLAALRAGRTPNSRVVDSPLQIGDWSPDNYGDRYRGAISLREAFAVSSNVGAVRLAEEIGRDEVFKAARDLGVTGELEEGPTAALGTSGVPLIDMVAAYAAVRAGRYPIRPHGLPGTVEDADTTPMDERVRADMMQLLWAAANEGSGRAAVLPVATFGKTGTSQDGRDAFFIGFAGDLVTGVWIGYDDNRPMPGLQGGGLPAQIWRKFMSKAVAMKPGPAPVEFEPQAPTPADPAGHGAAPVMVSDYDVEAGTEEPVTPAPPRDPAADFIPAEPRQEPALPEVPAETPFDEPPAEEPPVAPDEAPPDETEPPEPLSNEL